MHQQWTMPPRVLQIVASLIALAAIASFAMGVLSSPQRGGRLPGEKVPGAASASAPIDAEDATPLADERIQGPPPPAANEQADDNNSAADAGANAAAAGNAAPPAASAANAQPVPLQLPPANATPPQTLGGPPAPDEPPH